MKKILDTGDHKKIIILKGMLVSKNKNMHFKPSESLKSDLLNWRFEVGTHIPAPVWSFLITFYPDKSYIKKISFFNHVPF